MTADDEHGGMIARCPHCEQEVRIPASDAEALVPVRPIGTAAAAPEEAAGGEEALLFAEQLGLEVEAPAPSEPAESGAVLVGGEPPADAEHGVEHDAHAELAAEGGDTSMAARAARSARNQAAARRKAQLHFKKAAIPLMLALSGILLLIAIYSAVELARGVSDSARQRAVLMMFSWPVVAVLLSGVWWFRRDIRRSEQG